MKKKNSNERTNGVCPKCNHSYYQNRKTLEYECQCTIDAEVLKDVMENIVNGKLVNGFVGFTVEAIDEDHGKYIGAMMMEPEKVAAWVFNEIESRPEVKEHFMNIMMHNVIEKLERKSAIRIDE